MQLFSIGEIARRAGIATSTIRYYERIGLLPPSQRLNGRRRYDITILDKLNVIRLAQAAGFTLTEIHSLLYSFPSCTQPGNRWQAFAGKKINELDEMIKQAQRRKALLEHMQDCQCLTLEVCASDFSSAVSELDGGTNRNYG